MFFRREKLHEPSFQERIENLKKYKFSTQNEGGKTRVMRDGLAAIVADVTGHLPHIEKEGLAVGKDIGLLMHGGYQMFFVTDKGIRRPALADQLNALHAFQEDLREGLGLISLYNEGLGTTCDLHMYDRVEERDRTHQPRAWEKLIT